MALQILRRPSISNEIGENFGSGLGQGLQSLAQLKLKEFQQRQLEQQLQQGGLPAVLAHLDPQVQASYLREYGSSLQRSKQEDINALQEQLLQQAMGNSESQGMNKVSPLLNMNQNQYNESNAPNILDLLSSSDLGQFNKQTEAPSLNQELISQIQQFMNNKKQEQQLPNEIQNLFQPSNQFGQNQMQDSALSQELRKEQQKKTDLKAQALNVNTPLDKLKREIKESTITKLSNTVSNLDKQLQDPSIPNKLKSKLREEREKKKLEFEKRSDRLKDKHGDFIAQITEKDAKTKELLDAVKRQQELNVRGQLTKPGTLKFLEEVGLDIDALKSNDTQEFIKNNGIFMRNLKELFGGRITDNEINMYMKSIANEYQSPEGRRRILASQEKLFKSELVRSQALDKILELNNGTPTEFIKRDIEKIAKPEIDKLAKEFKETLEKDQLSDAESDASIFAKTVAGKALSSVGNLLKKAGPVALGAKLGSTFGPSGALTGGILAGLGNLFGK